MEGASFPFAPRFASVHDLAEVTVSFRAIGGIVGQLVLKATSRGYLVTIERTGTQVVQGDGIACVSTNVQRGLQALANFGVRLERVELPTDPAWSDPEKDGRLREAEDRASRALAALSVALRGGDSRMISMPAAA